MTPFRHSVREYYETVTPMVLSDVGHTYQAGTLVEWQEDPYRETNEFLAMRMNIKPGDKLLDAGCGAGGPAVDIARVSESTTIDAITISAEQASAAHRRILDESFQDRIRVMVGDYHALPFLSDQFDVVYFFETLGYSDSLTTLFSEVYRVLKPGGLVYIKDVFVRSREITDIERDALEIFKHNYRCNLPAMEEVAGALEQEGLGLLSTDDFTGTLDKSLVIRAKVEHGEDGSPIIREGKPLLTEFGKHHVNPLGSHVPFYFGEIRALKGHAE